MLLQARLFLCLLRASASMTGSHSLNYVERVGGDALTGEMIRIRNRALEYLGFPGKASERAI
jgi:hypothetical protein